MKSDSDEKLEMLLEALFDGEGASSQVDDLRAKVQQGDPAISARWESLVAVRDEVRRWHTDLKRDGVGRERAVDLWTRISSDLRKEERVPRHVSWLERFAQQARQAFSVPVFAGALAVVAIGMVSLFSGSQDREELQVASVVGVSSGQLGVVRVSQTHEVAPLRLPAAMSVAYRDEISRHRSMRMIPILPTSDKNFVLGGLRSHGADIDWVKSEQPVKLLPLDDDQGAPPIIWVTRHNPALDAYAGLD